MFNLQYKPAMYVHLLFFSNIVYCELLPMVTHTGKYNTVIREYKRVYLLKQV